MGVNREHAAQLVAVAVHQRASTGAGGAPTISMPLIDQGGGMAKSFS